MIIRIGSALVLLLSLGWAVAFSWAAIVGGRAMAGLIATYGDRSGFEWCQVDSARELFHGDGAKVASILHAAIFVAPVVMAAGVVATQLLVTIGRQREGLSAIGVFVITVSLVLLSFCLHSDSIWAISCIVE